MISMSKDKLKGIVKIINEFLEIDDSYKAPEAVMNILYDKDKRENLFRKMLPFFQYDVSYDWFREYYESEQAERKSKKQDFTPQCITELVSKIVGNNNKYTYDCCCGTGGITISKWYNDCMQSDPLKYFPSQHIYFCEELSDKAIPFLIFNCLIRGMNAIIIQCDVLTRDAKGVFFIYNEQDNYLGFSNFNVMPYTIEMEEEFNIHYTGQYYKDHIENGFKRIIE